MKRTRLHELNGINFDVIIIGGGITGAAIARDAALRGLKTILVEKEDIASGTSSRSSKLIHGGLRYLETYQFSLVAESVRERELALKLAPHLTTVQPFLYLLYADAPDKKWLLNLGLTFYDVVSGDWRGRRHHMLSKNEVLRRQPQFREQGLLGAAMYYDVSTDDARITIDTMKNATEHGAALINHCEVTGLIYTDNRCHGVKVKDRLSQVTGEILGHYVINATGPWSDNILGFDSSTQKKILRPTKGVHIVLRKKDFPIHSAVFMRSPDDGRVVWPIPSMQDDRVFIGTTDTTYQGDLDNVLPEKSDIQYLLNVANHLMPTARLSEEHVIGSWAGLRPLIAPKDDLNNSKAPREHQIIQSDSDIFSIVGGKLTSHRVMAKHLLDEIIKKDQNKYLKANLLPYRAHITPISGASQCNDNKAVYSKNDIRATLIALGIPLYLAETWASRYGYNANKVAQYWLKDEKLQLLLAARNLTLAEVYYCVFEEAACSLADLLIRRTSAFFWDEIGGLEKIELIAQEMQTLLKWSDEEKQRNIDHYVDLVKKHRPNPIPFPVVTP